VANPEETYSLPLAAKETAHHVVCSPKGMAGAKSPRRGGSALSAADFIRLFADAKQGFPRSVQTSEWNYFVAQARNGRFQEHL
jgi:hypothetical protein